MALVHCIYCSAATSALKPAELQSLLDECRRKNAAAGISGMLLYHSGSFFQVLEGEQETVDALYEKINLDKRHRRTTKIIFEPIEARNFGAWTMGCPALSSTQLAQIPGLNDFFARGESYLELGAGRAKSLLDAFAQGQWRTAL